MEFRNRTEIAAHVNKLHFWVKDYEDDLMQYQQDMKMGVRARILKSLTIEGISRSTATDISEYITSNTHLPYRMIFVRGGSLACCKITDLLLTNNELFQEDIGNHENAKPLYTHSRDIFVFYNQADAEKLLELGYTVKKIFLTVYSDLSECDCIVKIMASDDLRAEHTFVDKETMMYHMTKSYFIIYGL